MGLTNRVGIDLSQPVNLSSDDLFQPGDGLEVRVQSLFCGEEGGERLKGNRRTVKGRDIMRYNERLWVARKC
jgi:hypothetical protein